MKNILIVESENDQYFIEALVKQISTETSVYRIDEYKHSSLDEKNLTTQITNALTDVSRGVSKIGIILDMDDSTQKDRIDLINRCFKKAARDSGLSAPPELENMNKFLSYRIREDEDLKTQIACFFTNIDGQGELETVLWEIKSEESVFADCLKTGWLSCLKGKKTFSDEKGKPCDISGKELLKLQIDFYKRFDTLKRADRDEKNTDWRGIMTGITKHHNEPVDARGEDIFNLNHEKLEDIKKFLKMFN